MTLPSTIRGRVIARFPTHVQGTGGISVEKEAGVWTISPNWTDLNLITTLSDPANTHLWVLDPDTGVYSRLSAQALIDELPDGPPGGFQQTFDVLTADADPGNGEFRFNHATLASVTAAYLDNLDLNGATISALIDTFDDSTSTTKGRIRFQHATNPAIFAEYFVTGTVVDGTGYRKLTLTHIASAGTFAGNFAINFVPAGELGATGPIAAIGFNFSTTTADADPGSGNVRFNNATPASVTAIYADNLDRDGNTVTAWLDSFDDSTSTIKGTLVITPAATPSAKLVYSVTGSVVDGTGYRKITVAHIAGATLPSNLANLAFEFSPKGDIGGLAGFRQTYSATTTDADPGAGIFRFNNATVASATASYLDNADAGGSTVSGVMDLWDDSTNTIKGTIRYESIADPTMWVAFEITGSVVDGTGYRKLTLQNGQAGPTAFSGVFAVTFQRAGNKGADGAGTGDVVGPASSTDHAIARYDLTTGKLLQDSSAIITDAGKVEVNLASAVTNTVGQAQKFSHTTSDTPAAGIGVGVEFEVETAAGNNEIGATIEAVTTDVTGASEDFALAFKTMAAGAAAAERARLNPDGGMTLPETAAPATPASGKAAIYPKADGRYYEKDDAGVERGLSPAGKQSVNLLAAGMVKRTTNGATIASAERATNDVMYSGYTFSAGTEQAIQLKFILPKGFDSTGALTMRFGWTTDTAGTGNVMWGARLRYGRDDDAQDAAFGTGVTVTDAFLLDGDDHISAESSAITPAGTYTFPAYLYVELYRKAADAADTYSQTSVLECAQLGYFINAATDV